MAAVLGSSPLSISPVSSPPRPSPTRQRASRAFLALRPARSPVLLRALSQPPAPPPDSDPVEVIGIGSRKDSVIDFCLSSRAAASSRVRFWTVQRRDSSKVQFIQRCRGADVVLRDVEFPLSLQPCPPAVILVASAGHCVDHVTAIELLNSVKSAGALAVSINLRPFSFEGQRRQEEANDLFDKLRECSHFHIVIEADSLLKTEVETLSEALESANNAVLLAISMISTMMSGSHQMFHSSPYGPIKEIKPVEVLKLIESYGEAKVGFGAGYNIKSAIKQAVFLCPFLRGGIKDLNGVVFVDVTSSCVFDESHLVSIISALRRLTEFTKEVIVSTTHEPDLEPNLVVITLLVVGCIQNMDLQKKGFLSSLLLRFPFLSSLIREYLPEPGDSMCVHSPHKSADNVLSSAGKGSFSSVNSVNSAFDFLSAFFEEKETKNPNSESNCGDERTKLEFMEVNDDLVSDENMQSNGGFRRESGFWNIGHAFNIAQIWAKERSSLNQSNNVDELDVFPLPVGVKYPGVHFDHSPNSEATTPETLDVNNKMPFGIQSISWGKEFTDALALLKGKNVSESRKRGLLSVRAASMLEGERELGKTWSQVTEIQYRGGIYRGRCQGGLPEGKPYCPGSPDLCGWKLL